MYTVQHRIVYVRSHVLQLATTSMASTLLISSSSLLLPSPHNGRVPCKASLRPSSATLLHGLLPLRKERVISSQSSPQNCMSFVATALGGLLLSCLLSSDLKDFSIARAADFGRDYSSKQQIAPSKGNCPTCLGVVDETLGACGAAPNCVSTFDDRPAFFIAPWEFPGKLTTAFESLKRAIINEGGDIVEEGDRYIHVVFIDKDGTVDDLEVLFSIPSEDATMNIRSASRKVSQGDNGRNQKRLERVRRTLMWEEVPVLRNRSRKLFFLESPWDTFGPEPPPAFDYSEKLDFVPD